MALDEVLWRGGMSGGGPFLRFYTWDPPGLSLGRFQRDLAGVDLRFCRSRGIPVVRRLTGGRAVLHHRELTYSIGASFAPPFEDSGVVAVYRRIAQGLAAGLARLGLLADPLSRRAGAGGHTANCFASVSRCEITQGGRKLVGSAQVREQNGFLQHGSILMDLDSPLWQGVFRSPDPSRAALGLREALGRLVGELETAIAVAEGMAQELGMPLIPSQPTRAELERADILARERYRDPCPP